MRLKNLPEDQQKEIRKGKENKERFHSHQKVDLSQAFKK
jgi:hypothetical protein